MTISFLNWKIPLTVTAPVSPLIKALVSFSRATELTNRFYMDAGAYAARNSLFLGWPKHGQNSMILYFYIGIRVIK